MKETVGFIGLGSMGKRMAANVLGKGFPLWVYDLRAEACNDLGRQGAHVAENLKDIVLNCNWIVLSLPDRPAVESVLFGEGGLESVLREGQIIVDCGTTHPDFTRQAASTLAKRGVALLDAPVTGLESRAEAGSLTIMVGGDEGAFKQVLPLLETMGEIIVHMGSSGNGQLMKITNNVLYNISVAAMAEMLPLAVRLGLDPEKVRTVVGKGSGQSFGFDFFSELVLKRKFSTGFPMGIAFKDMAAVIEKADEQKVPLPVASAAMQTYKMALAQGLGEESKGAMVKVWEKIMGVEVRSKP
ncbi:MAG: NAD(P)-dependent oxidoreductase [Deltaproteobacteria bacterium]|nr:NAD(P)-dependent oxidoreductase [Deltaproteobacteria bacterium]